MLSKNKNIKIKIPGKLILTGEWSILEKNNSCIVLAINKFLEVNLKQNNLNKIIFNSKDINLENIKLSYKNNKLKIETNTTKQKRELFKLSFYAIKIAFKYLQNSNIKIKNNFNIFINSNISKIKLKNNYFTKIGLGSSAATVVGIISAILKLHDFKINQISTKNLIFKLSIIAHYLAQNKTGSGADIACCAYKKNIIYKKFDTTWFNKNIKNKNIISILENDWPNLEIKLIKLPENLIILAAFSGQSASTKNLIQEILKSKKENKKDFNNIKKDINNVVLKIIDILKNKKLDLKQQENFLELIKINRLLLKKLNKNLETQDLKKLTEIATTKNSAAKFSGAGGGDCGIAICFDKKIAQKIICDWEKNNFYPIKIFK
ncbi:phosphomevalonate kinase [Candidatus Babeliales bacterium]|nr:phosphomevalonate kinase [Candidatus Babeliales bacterium]